MCHVYFTQIFCIPAMHGCPNWSLNLDACITLLGFVWVYTVYGYLGSEGSSRCGNSGGVCCKRTQCENVWLLSKLFLLCQFGTCIKLSETFNPFMTSGTYMSYWCIKGLVFVSVWIQRIQNRNVIRSWNCVYVFITFFMLKIKTHFQEGKFQDLKSMCL
jgi:hypothetical protein